MSIIHQALKKVQASLDKRSPSPMSNTPSSSSSSDPALTKKRMVADSILGRGSHHPTPEEANSIIAPSNQPQTQAQQSPTKAKKAEVKKGPSNAPLLLFILLVLAGCFVYQYKLIDKSFTKKTEKLIKEQLVEIKKMIPTSISSNSNPSTPAKTSAEAVASQPKKEYTPDKLFLNGIMTVGDKTVAVINDEIIEQGGVIHNRKLITIGIDRVELKDLTTGEASTLHLN